MGERNRAYFDVTARLLEEALHFPDGVNIVGAAQALSEGSIRLYVKGPDFRVLEPGVLSTKLVPTCISVRNPTSDAREYFWDWGLSPREVNDD